MSKTTKTARKSVTTSKVTAKRTKAIAKGAKTTAKKPAKASTARSPRFEHETKITVLPVGRKNPRKTGTGAFKRYEGLLKARTVGAFLEKFPGRTATVRNALNQKLIKLG
jgi:hypothetical protein